MYQFEKRILLVIAIGVIVLLAILVWIASTYPPRDLPYLTNFS